MLQQDEVKKSSSPSPKDRPGMENDAPRTVTQKKSHTLLYVVIIAAVIGIIWWRARSNSTAADKKGAGAPPPVPVVAGKVMKKDVPIYLDGLGTVQAYNTVTVHVRVDGQLVKVAFNEGQDVKEGDILAQIDPAPFQATYDQAVAKQGQDEALLANDRLDLQRYSDLYKQKVIAQQQYDTQVALVHQYEATVKTDAAAVESAKVNLDYATVRTPISGRTGVRLVDQGNIVHAADTTGIVVITQLQPIFVTFTLPEQNLVDIHKQTSLGQKAAQSEDMTPSESNELAVLATDRQGKTTLDEGKLAVINNQIDPTTGTIQLKASFENSRLQLWPGQFVNTRLHLTTRKDGLVVPASVIQRGPEGPNSSYAFVIKPDETVEIRPVKVNQVDNGEALIDDGLKEGEQVVVDGQYKLQDGSHVKISQPSSSTKPKSSATPGGSELQ